MAIKKIIPQLPETTSPDLNGYIVYDDTLSTYKLNLDNLFNLIRTEIPYFYISGATYSNGYLTLTQNDGSTLDVLIEVPSSLVDLTYDKNNGVISLTNSSGGTSTITGFTTNVQHWIENDEKVVNGGETIVISGDYVLENTNLTLMSDNRQISIGNLVFNKYAQIFIGGSLLLVDSNIINNGQLSVAGGIILSGNSTITGTGIII